ncbi:lipoprotein 17-related variable surface protein [Mycoplasma bradburyae]|uniref:lipoprotein 17-related variable surface protein n=1 Tax=Mycoplasma bradburyae TaxID=2963128 RepID=UPI0020CEB642|nr:lipoprotein 17-related variable surface protein [Mycoplasma bradburyae]UTS70547.1 lipoprotein 17-related variable surface protein [Mycoplasma bradburyae]
MKRKNILKFISLLGVGSFVALSAASCKQPVTEKPTKPTEPKNPDNGGGTTTTPPTTGGGGGATTSNPSGGSDGSNNMTPSEPTNSKKAVEAYVKTLMPDSFKLVNSSNAEIAKDSIKASEVTKENIKLKENNPATEGWTLGVELVSNSDSTNPENDSVKFKIKFTKESDEVTSNEITISGFKTLKSSIASVLLKTASVKDEQGEKVNKTVLDLGSAEFKKLSELNKQITITTSSLERSLRTTDDVNEPNVSKTSELAIKFKSLITNNESEIKNELNSLKTNFNEFDPEKLYLSGEAELVSIIDSEQNQSQASYYLTSKDENNKLSIKYEDNPNWSIILDDGIVLKDLLPDDIKISVYIKDGDRMENSSSNIDEYKEKIKSEGSESTRYSLDSNNNLKFKVSVNANNSSIDKIVNVDPIKLPYIGEGKVDKIFFKSKYIFDGKEIFDDKYFGTKLIFKKIHNIDSGSKKALDSSVVNNSGNGLGSIPGRMGDSVTDWKSVLSSNDANYFFSKNDNSNEFNDLIYGTNNSSNGDGVVQLIENNIMSGNINVTKINNNNPTTFIIFSRVAYKKSATTFGYYWPNSVTILYFANRTN